MLEPHQHSSKSVRSASLNTSSDLPRGWWVNTLFALLPIFLTAGVLAYRWESIPARFPIHWGFDGRPNGWSGRNPWSIFGPLVVSGILVLTFTLLGELVLHDSPGHGRRPAMLHTCRNALRGAAWLISLLFCAISLSSLAPDPTTLVPLVVAGCVCSSLGLVLYITYSAMRMPEETTASENAGEDRFWKGGLLYFNPADRALMVPKRQGIGYTLNFARPVSWLILGGIVLVSLGLPLAMHFAGKR